MDRAQVSRIRQRVIEIAEGLPEVVAEGRGRHIGFGVRGRRFAWYLDDHHGDGRLSLTCKVDGDLNRDLVRSHPDHYYMPPYVAHRGWVGYWLDGHSVDWDEVGDLIVDAYRLVAPRGLLAQWDKRAL